VDLTRDFDEFFGSLIDSGVEFLVFGAYALAFIGRAELVRNKRAAWRLKDLADLEVLGAQE
jgi:hypothetical protein